MSIQKQKLAKSFLAKVVTLTMVVGMMLPSNAVVAKAAANDIAGHWAASTITEWQDKGLIAGYSDGSFKPDKPITRAEFVTLINSSMALTEKGNVNFTDVSSSDWFYNNVAIAMGAGYCSGFPDGTFKPSSEVTRAQAARFVSSAAGLGDNTSGAAKFTDASSLPDWALGSIGTLSSGGIMSGYPDGTFSPNKNLSRAEAVFTLNKVITDEKPEVPAEKPDSITVTEKGQRVADMDIKGDLIISSSVGSGEVYLSKVTIGGDLIVEGGGSNSISAEDVIVAGKTKMNYAGARIIASGKTDLNKVEFSKYGTIETKDYSGKALPSVSIVEDLGDSSSASVTLRIAVDELNVLKKAYVKVTKLVGKLNVSSNATNSSIYIDGTTITTAIVDAVVAFLGEGKIASLEANVDGITKSSDVSVTKTTGEYTVASSKGGGGGGGAGGGNNGDDDSSGDKKPVIVRDLDIKEAGETIKGGTYNNVTITDAVGEGDVTLDGVNIKGTLNVNGGGAGTITLKDTTVKTVVVGKISGAAPRILGIGTTQITNVDMTEPAFIEMKNENVIESIKVGQGATGSTIKDATVTNTIADASLTIQGGFSSNITANAATIIKDATVTGNLSVSSNVVVTATDSDLTSVSTSGKLTLSGSSVSGALTVTDKSATVVLEKTATNTAAIETIVVSKDVLDSTSADHNIVTGEGVVNEIKTTTDGKNKAANVVAYNIKGTDNKPPTITVILMVKSVTTLVPLQKVAYGTSVSVVINALAAVAPTVKVTLSDNSEIDVAVVWSATNYNSNVAGTYNFTGKLTNLPANTLDGGLVAKGTVEVSPQTEAVTSFAVSPTQLTAAGGKVTATIGGVNLNPNNYSISVPGATVGTISGNDGSTSLTAEITLPANASSVDNRAYTITLSGAAKSYTATATVLKADKVVKDIVVTTLPTKVSYEQGAKFNPAGLVITLNYDNGTSIAITNYTLSTDIIGKTVGTETIGVSYKEGSKTVTTSFDVTVTYAKPSISIKTNPADATIDTASSTTLSAAATATTPTGSVDVTYQWYKGSGSDATLIAGATSGNYLVDGSILGVGTYSYSCKFTATNDKVQSTASSNTITVVVTAKKLDPAVTSVTVTPATANLLVDKTQQLAAVVNVVGGAETTVTWSSNDDSIATVDENGLVTAKSAGNTTIKATSTADPTKSATATITVTAPPTVTTVNALDLSSLIVAPVTGNTPNTKIDSAQYTGTITWLPVATTFAAETVYTATVTLTATSGYTFDGLAANSFKYTGATTVTNEVNSGVVKIAFKATAKDSEPTTKAVLTIKTPPTKISYTSGDALDLGGLVVTLTVDGTAKDISVAEFTDNNLSVNFTSGTVMSIEMHNDKPITVTHTDGGVTTTATTTDKLIVTEPVKQNALLLNHSADRQQSKIKLTNLKGSLSTTPEDSVKIKVSKSQGQSRYL